MAQARRQTRPHFGERSNELKQLQLELASMTRQYNDLKQDLRVFHRKAEPLKNLYRKVVAFERFTNADHSDAPTEQAVDSVIDRLLEELFQAMYAAEAVTPELIVSEVEDLTDAAVEQQAPTGYPDNPDPFWDQYDTDNEPFPDNEGQWDNEPIITPMPVPDMPAWMEKEMESVKKDIIEDINKQLYGESPFWKSVVSGENTKPITLADVDKVLKQMQAAQANPIFTPQMISKAQIVKPEDIPGWKEVNILWQQGVITIEEAMKYLQIQSYGKPPESDDEPF